MEKVFDNIAAAARYIRIQRNITQNTAAEEAAISLRTLQNIEAGKPVQSESLFRYLSYLDLLENMLGSLPDPNQLTPIEQLKSAPKRRERVRRKPGSSEKNTAIDLESEQLDRGFIWGDEK